MAASTSTGKPALDVPAAVVASLAGVGIEVDVASSSCTACEADRYWSHRARGDVARQAAVAWLA